MTDCLEIILLLNVLSSLYVFFFTARFRLGGETFARRV